MDLVAFRSFRAKSINVILANITVMVIEGTLYAKSAESSIIIGAVLSALRVRRIDMSVDTLTSF